MASYQSQYTGAQIDAAVGAINNVLENNGAVSVNGLDTILADYLTSATATSTYLTQSDAASTYLTQSDASNTYIPLKTTSDTEVFLRGDNTWSDTLTGALNISGILHTSNPEYTVLDSGYIMTNCAAYATDTSSVTGTLKITLPLSNGHTVMQMIEVWIYDYSSLSGSQLIISGYTYSDSKWYNYACKIQGNYNRGCRMAFDGSKYCILLGTTSTTWSYPQIFIPKYYGGFSQRTHVHDSRPTISFITSESGYTITGSAS